MIVEKYYEDLTTLNGPKVSDEDFFRECIDWSLPGLEELKQAMEAKNYDKAKELFATYIKQSLRVDLFDSIPYEVPENQYKTEQETEIKAAERISSFQLMACGIPHQFVEKVDWIYNPTYNQYKEWVWQLNRHNEWKLLAHAYRQTGNERYAKAFVEMFTSWVVQAVAPGKVSGIDTMCWRTIECGIRMGANWPYAFHTFVRSEACTNQVIVDWYKSLWEHGKRLREHHTQGNWLVMEMNGLGHIGILAPILRESKEWREYAFHQLEIELDRQLYQDGFQYELSTGYHEVLINNYGRFIRTSKAYSIPIPQSFYDKLERATMVHIALMMPDGRTPDINDARWDKVEDIMESKVELFPENEQIQWLVSKGQKGKLPAYDSVALPYSGFMVMRTGWTSEDSWVLFDAAPFGYAHQHEDKLSVLYYSNGKLLVTEGGNYPYDDSEMRKYILSTRSHNTIRVNGFDQNRRSVYEWKEEEIHKHSGMKFQITPDYDIAQGVYKEGYGEDNIPYATHKRTLYYMKSYGWLSNVLVVIDEMNADQEREYEVLWHLDVQKGKVEGMAFNSEELSILTSADDGTLRIIEGQTEPEWQGFRPRSFVQGDYEPIPTLQQKVSGKTKTLITVLSPNEKGKAKIAKIKTIECSKEPRIVLVNEMGEEVTLPKFPE